MIVPRIPDSFLYDCTPWDRMSCDESLISCIWRITIVVLIYDDDRFRIAIRIADDIDEDRNMFATSICESIVRLSVETCDHESLVFRGESALWSQGKIHERLPWFPLICRCISLIRYYLGKCGTLSCILASHSPFRKLRIYTCRSI
mgnify:CR=1 FL=1